MSESTHRTEDRFLQPHRLLWIDGSGGALVGAVVLALAPWLSGWYGLPLGFVRFMGLVNLAYGCYSLTLASRPRRPMPLIVLLVVANLGWAVACLRWAWLYRHDATWLGMAQLLVEGLYVGALGLLEWRWRRSLTVC